MIISLISEKGGVGKSALARLMAVVFANAGWSVKIADLDTQRGPSTSMRWKARRDNAGFTPEIPVEKYANAERAIRDAQSYDLMILDGPAHAGKTGRIMADASDLVILPTQYGIDDMAPQVEAAYELEDKGVPSERIIFVFCKTTGSESENLEARNYLKRAGVNVLDPVFQEWPCVRHAHNEGKAACEVSPKSVQDKINLLAQDIADRIANSKKGAAA